jgi:phosphate/sulfate permease
MSQKFHFAVGSWFVSPVLSGVISVSLYLVIRRLILNASDPIARGLLSLPIFYGITIFINVFTIVHDGSSRKWNTVSPEAEHQSLIDCRLLRTLEDCMRSLTADQDGWTEAWCLQLFFSIRRFPALPEKKSSGFGPRSTQPCEYN